MQNIRNIAIIAHVDHGKTTLVDKMLLAGNLFRSNQSTGELMLDNNDLERERGITILSKNVSISYKDTKINIIDTPGHSDFGGEVERVLNMADGCILLVDAFEGPMPQTRFVLQKALQIGLKPIVVVNKVDKPNCRPEEVYEMVFDLMFSLEATEEQLDFPVIYGSAKNNWMSTDWQKQTDNIYPLLDCILENIPAPTQLEGTPQMLVTSLDYSSYTGRIAVGRVHRGTLKEGMNVTLVKRNGDMIIEGEITQYQQRNKSVSSEGYSAQTELSMTVNVRFTNNTNHNEDFERQFTATATYETTESLNSVQERLVEQMVKDLTEQIFNAAVANW